MTKKYQSVNGAWPETVPPLTGSEAASAGRRLYRLVMKRPFKGKIKVSSGNHYTWIRSGVMIVNPSNKRLGGWKELVHSLSHYCHRKLYPSHKPHDGRGTHAFIERTMIEHVVNSGWLDGKLKRPAKAAIDVKQLRHRRVLARIEAWEAKQKRARNALKKLQRQARYYEKQLTQASAGQRA